MQGGQLDRELKIFKPIVSKDSFGEEDIILEQIDTDWAKRKDLFTAKDNERVLNNSQLIASGITQFTLRYREDIESDYLFEDEEGIKWKIVGQPLIRDRRQFITFNCENRDNV